MKSLHYSVVLSLILLASGCAKGPDAIIPEKLTKKKQPVVVDDSFIAHPALATPEESARLIKSDYKKGEITALCDAAITRTREKLAAIAAEYHDAVTQYARAIVEVCGGKAPAIPLPWASRGVQPLGWQFDGDKGLYIPSASGGLGKGDVDVNLFARSRLYETLHHRDTDPAPWDPTPPALRLSPTEVPSLEQVLQELTEPPPDSTEPTNPGTPTSISTSTMHAVRPEET